MAFQVTKEQVKKWSACSDGYRWFLENFPQGGEYAAVQAALRTANRFDDVRWLADRMFSDAMATPALVSDIVGDHIADAALIIKSAPTDECGGDEIGSSGNGARIGSSGYGARIGSSGYSAQIGSSGNGAQIGSSGYGTRIGSSGNGARIGSSGYGTRINAEGENAVVACAGFGCHVRTGAGGAIAAAYHDGTRVRFAVGYVGEDLKPLTWYRVSDVGAFVAVEA